MSELIYPDEALPELNDEHPLRDDIEVSLHASASGTLITNLVDGSDHTIGTFTKNSDGSLSSGVNGTGSAIFPVDDFIMWGKSFVFILDAETASANDASTDPFMDGGSSQPTRNGIYVRSDQWNTGSLRVRYYDNWISFSPLDNANNFGDVGRKLTVVAYDGDTKILTMFQDGVLAYTSAPMVATQGGGTMAFGIGGAGDKFYSSTYLSRDGAFTPEEVDEIVTNPYQLFKTDETVEQEYALVGGGYVTVPCAPLPNVDGSLVDITVGYAWDGVDGEILSANGLAGWRLEAYLGVLYLSGTSTSFAPTISQSYKLRLSYIRGVFGVDYPSMLLYVDDVLQYTDTNTNQDALDTLLARTGGTNISGGTVTSLRIHDHQDSTNSRYWDFNKTRGDYVEDHYNGAIATLVGFPADSGYVRAWGVSDGLEFDGTQYATFPAWTVPVGADFQMSGTFEKLDDGVSSMLVGHPSSNVDYIHKNTNNDILFRMNGLNNTITGVPAGMCDFTIARINNSEITATFGGVTLLITAGQDFTLGAFASYNNYAVKYPNKLVNVAMSHATDSRYYDFTKIRGNSLIVPETLNGQDGTMVGFPNNGVFVPEKNKTLVGQKLSTTTGDFVSAPVINSYSYPLTITARCKPVAVQFYTSFRIFWNGAWSSSNGFRLDIDSGNLRFTSGSDEISIPLGDLPIDVYSQVCDYTLDDDGSKWTLYQNTEPLGSLVYTVGLATATGTLNIGNRGGTNPDKTLNGIFEKFTYIDQTPTNTRTLDFSIESGNTIMDTSGNDNHGTVVGGELQRVYDYNGYGEIAGYNFDGAVIGTFPLWTATDDFTLEGDFNHKDATEIFLGHATNTVSYLANLSGGAVRIRINNSSFNLSGVPFGDTYYKVSRLAGVVTYDIGGVTGTYNNTASIELSALATYNNGSLKYSGLMTKCILTNGTDDRNYDFTTGDQGKIVETIQGKHAIISNDSVVKWQPIVPVDVFTDSDYASASDFSTARKNSSGLQHYKFSGVQELTAPFDAREANFMDGYIMEGIGEPFNGDINDASVATITRLDGYISNLVDDRTSGRGTLKNLIVNAKGIRALNSGGSFVGAALINNQASTNSKQLTFLRSTLHSLGQVWIADTATGKVSFTDSLVIGNTDLGTGLVRNRSGGKVEAINTLFYNEGTADTFDTENTAITGSNNISNSAGATSIGTQADMTGWFDANGQITPAGRTAIGTDTGWNSSTIAGWADAGVSVGTLVEVNATLVTSLSEVTSPFIGVMSPAMAVTGNIATSGSITLDPEVYGTALIGLLPSSTNTITQGLNPEIYNTANVFVSGVVTTSLVSVIDPLVSLTASINLTPVQVNTRSVVVEPIVANIAVVGIIGGLTSTTSTTNNPTVLSLSEVTLDTKITNSLSVSLQPTIQTTSGVFLDTSVVDTYSNSLVASITLSSVLDISTEAAATSSQSLPVILDLSSSLVLHPITVHTTSSTYNPLVSLTDLVFVGAVESNTRTSTIDPEVFLLSEVGLGTASTRTTSEALTPHILFNYEVVIGQETVTAHSSSIDPKLLFSFGLQVPSRITLSSTASLNPEVLLYSKVVIARHTIDYADNQVTATYATNGITISYGN